MNIKELLLNQFRACHYRDTWFVSLNTALEGLSSEQASCKSKDSTNSILEIVNHLYFYNQLELNRFKGIANNVNVSDNKVTFSDLQKTSWTILVEQIFKTMTDWENVIESSDEAHLKKCSENLTYINLHNAYHIGQILYIRKSRGIWDGSGGINYTF
ncbi:hypothetical protein CR203_24945 [Salipaludibacillus neizhouensis]|uniref:DinB-like domain-containing protein n=1 Tax=Salipaludibacillus neizhouensis TaxID=885475 RepID=A0A3A9K4Q6_9BACI|nr:DinB family protein [Salipaludibacillus neizhouensis]RKL64693.1 hypothetical protein CR203_24945 [Salipaludibacillus neizhouensis]